MFIQHIRPLFLGLLILTFSAHARWATIEDAPAQWEKVEERYQIEKDGSHSLESEVWIRVLNEQGRTSVGTQQFTYDAETTRFKVLLAETLLDGKPSKQSPIIEDKALAGSSEMLHTFNQISVIFPDVRVQSVLHFKIRMNVWKPTIPHYFAQEFYFGPGVPQQQKHVVIHSKLPLQLHVNDPQQSLVVQKKLENDETLIEISLQKPVYTATIDEEDGYLPYSRFTHAVVSSIGDYGELAERFARQYEQRLNEPLPQVFQNMVEKASTEKTPSAKINSVTAQLADQIRYLADWREFQSGVYPRSFEVVAATRYGDCKDFSTVTAAMLRKLGMKAQVAFVYRGAIAPSLYSVAFAGSFNHALTRVQLGKQTRWIDPTNRASFADGIFEDLLDRPALVIETGKSRLEAIPQGKPSQATSTANFSVNFGTGNDSHFDGMIHFTGRAALGFTGAFLYSSKAAIESQLARSILERGYVKQYEFSGYDLSSRIAADIRMKTTLVAENYAMKTNAGKAILLQPPELYKKLDFSPDGRAADIVLYAPQTRTVRIVVKNAKLIGKRAMKCQVRSPWFSAYRTIQGKGTSITVEDSIQNMQSVITNEDFHSEAFQSAKQRLGDCIGSSAVVFQLRKPAKNIAE